MTVQQQKDFITALQIILAVTTGCDPGGEYVGQLVRQDDGRYRWHGAY